MQRTWAESVFLDFMCREMPALRTADVTNFLVPTSSLGFRNSSQCLSCHSTMDPLSGLIRNFQKVGLPTSTDPDLVGYVYLNLDQSFVIFANWLDEPNSNFWKSPPIGRLIYRTYKGKLVDKNLEGLHELGKAILAEDDYFACMSSRYYKYFTGNAIKLFDIGSNRYTPSNNEKAHLDVITKLSDCFKADYLSQDQLTKSRAQIRLIKNIFNLANYQSSNSSVAPNPDDVCSSS